MFEIPAAMPYADQWFGAWCMEPQRFAGVVSLVEHADLRSHLANLRSDRPRPAMKAQRSGRVAVVPIVGPMMKTEPSIVQGTSTVAARAQVREAMLAHDVDGIVLWIDSPGGTVAGTESLASDIRRAARVKPTFAYVDDCCCSAAYWVASQASKIFVTPTALTGSIGTYSSVEDVSGAYEKAGVRVVVVAAGKYKGIGTRGTKVTDEQIAYLQKMINALNEEFLQAVGAGRRMNAERVRAIADGGVFVGKAAIAAGLADAVGSFDQVMAEIFRTAGSSSLAEMQQNVARLTEEVQKQKSIADSTRVTTRSHPGGNEAMYRTAFKAQKDAEQELSVAQAKLAQHQQSILTN